MADGALFPLTLALPRGENSSKLFALCAPEPAGDGRARHSVRAEVWQESERRARSDAPYLEVHGEGACYLWLQNDG